MGEIEENLVIKVSLCVCGGGGGVLMFTLWSHKWRGNEVFSLAYFKIRVDTSAKANSFGYYY